MWVLMGSLGTEGLAEAWVGAVKPSGAIKLGFCRRINVN
jgi:hypothetical protein